MNVIKRGKFYTAAIKRYLSCVPKGEGRGSSGGLQIHLGLFIVFFGFFAEFREKNFMRFFFLRRKFWKVLLLVMLSKGERGAKNYVANHMGAM